MDNMLYIIAGLVLILLVAGLVLRKKKAQETSMPPAIQSGRKAATLTPTAKIPDSVPAHNREDIDKKFDHITIAQRFIDQQRHDKAIETLTRGLNEKPNDSQLLLKLLSVYATLDQPENFNNVYDTIKTQSNPQSITQANELKTLFFGEQAPVLEEQAPIFGEQVPVFEEQKQVFAKTAPVEEHTNFESIDFDLPISQPDDQKVLSDQPAVQGSNPTWANEQTSSTKASNDIDPVSATTETVENDFDLTLSDFDSDFEEHGSEERSFEEHPTTSAAPVNSSNDTETENFNTATVDETARENSDILDFDFEFEPSEADKAQAESSIASRNSDSTNEDMTLESEEFILDFDDLMADAETNTIADNKESAVDTLSVDANPNEDDFALSLDDFDAPIGTKAESENAALTLEEINDIDNFILENSDFEDLSLEEQLDDNSIENEITEASEMTSSTPLLFDDNTGLEDNVGVEPTASAASTASAPVETDSHFSFDNDPESTDDFSSRFSADFDFVKSLDSNQVTLDLAAQYVQLGEYDSAKRLLNEVINQGSHEQQNQARLLLKRTA